jgi:short-subunit dehydrogenase
MNNVIYSHYEAFPNIMKSEVLTMVTMNVTAFWDLTLCSLVGYLRFAGTYCLHLQGSRVSQASRNTTCSLILGCSFILLTLRH